MSVLLETSAGDIVIDLYTDKAPRTCLNFLKLCKVKYYNFSAFHRVESGFIAQAGDPTCTGKGGESIFGLISGNPAKRYFPAEIDLKLKHNKRGTVSMAVSAAGEDEERESGGVSGSQFFITLADDLTYLDGKYTIFGQVVEGFDVLDKLDAAMCDEKHRPFKDIRIKHMILLDDPFDDPEGMQVPDESPLPTREQLATVRIGEDEDIENEFGIDPELVEKARREQEARNQALTLEMIGDLPFAEIKPPENILFVCKLNPVTRDEDLELIFSRFGKIRSCEVIRDRKTGESLQYAFIEFDKKESCEEAYFKMDNVLIDDRRIHVDFSQSVSKLHKAWVQGRQEKLVAAGTGEAVGRDADLVYRKRYRESEESSGRGSKDGRYEMVFGDVTLGGRGGRDRSPGQQRSHRHPRWHRGLSRSPSPGSRHRRRSSRSGSQYKRDNSRDRHRQRDSRHNYDIERSRSNSRGRYYGRRR